MDILIYIDSRSLLLNIFCTLSPLNDCVPLLLLFLIWDPSSLCLTLLHLTKVHANSSAAKGVGLRRPSVLFVGRPKPSDERIKTPPCLSQRTGAWRRRIGLPKEDATVEVNLRFSELVQITKELEDVVEVTLGKRNWRCLVLEVLSKGVPVSALLRFVAAERGGDLLLMALIRGDGDDSP